MSGLLRRHAIFMKFFLCNICILLVPLLVSLAAYSLVNRAMRESTFALNRSQLVQASGVIDERLTALETAVTYLCSQADTERMVYDTSVFPTTSLGYYRIENMKRAISSHMLFNNIIQCAYVFLNNANMVISPYVSSSDPKDFYSDFLRIDKLPYEAWAEEYLYQNHSRHYFTPKTSGMDDTSTELFYFIQSIPVDPAAEPYGAILVTLRKEPLNRLITQQLQFSEGCWAAVHGPGGNLITQLGDAGSFPLAGQAAGDSQFLFDNEPLGRQFVTSVVSEKTGWRVTYAMPYDDTMERIHEVRDTLVVVFAAAFLLGTAVGVYLAYFNSKPLEQLGKVLTGEASPGGASSVFAYPLLIDSAKEVMSTNIRLREEVERQLPFVVTSFFQNLLRGSYSSAGEVHAILDKLGLDYTGKQVCVMIFKTSGYYDRITGSIFEEVSVQTAILKEAVHKAFTESAFVYDIDIDKVVAVAFLAADEAENLRGGIETRYHALRQNLDRDGAHIDFYIYVGSVCRDILDANRSYGEAESVMNGKLVSEKKILYFADTAFSGDALYYPPELETKLMNTLHSGNVAGVTEIMTSIYYQNVVVRHLPGSMAKSLYYDIAATLLKFCHGAEDLAPGLSALAEGLPKYYDVCANLEEGLDRVLIVCLRLCERMEEKKKSHNTDLAQKLTRRVNADFGDVNLSIVGLTEELSMNPTYLSALFREQTGRTFSGYLESLRVRKAAELLASTALRIEDIAAETGYNSAYTFRRAFKRVTGVSPKEKRAAAQKAGPLPRDAEPPGRTEI